MSPRAFVYRTPSRFVAGTIGQPGERAFYLQAEEGSRITSVLLEKQQVAALAERIAEVLDELGRDSRPMEPEDTAPLRMPLESEFRVAEIGFGWDEQHQSLILEMSGVAEDAGASDAPGDEANASLVVHLTDAQARSFVQRALLVVAAGRRACPLCAQPINTSGHVCPRANGFHRLGRSR